MRVGPHQGLDPGGDVGPLGARGDEPARRVGQHRAGGLGAGDGDGLPAQGRYDLAGPGGVAPGAVLLELGVDAGPAGLPQRGGGGAGRRRAFRDGVVPRPRSQDGLQGGVDLGVQAPDPALGLVDLSGQVQVETGQHAQRRGVLVRGADGSQGVGHGAGGAGDHGRVLRVGLGAARCQVGDAAHRSARAGSPR